MKNRILLILKILLISGILYWMWSSDKINLQRMKDGFRHWQWILPAFVCQFISPFLAALRIKLLLKDGNKTISMLDSTNLTFIGLFFSTWLPGTVSGDVIKAWYLTQINPEIKKGESLVTMLIDRIVGLSGLVITAFFSVLYNTNYILQHQKFSFVVLTIVLLLILVILFFLFIFKGQNLAKILLPYLSFSPKIQKLVTSLFNSFQRYQDRPRLMFYSLLLSCSTHIFVISSVFLFTQAVIHDSTISSASVLFLAPLGLILTAIPLSPAGLGVGHAAFMTLFSLGGISVGADIFSFFVLGNVFIGLLGIIPYLRFRKSISQIVTA